MWGKSWGREANAAGYSSTAQGPDPGQPTAWGRRRKPESLTQGSETQSEYSRLTCSPVRKRLIWEEVRVLAKT